MLLPDNTIYFDATIDSTGNIASLDKIPITDAADLVVIGSNLVLNTVLSRCYGIDIAGLVKDFDVTANDPRIVNLSPILKKCDWENATIIDSSTTPSTTYTALQYISNKFKIYSSNAFIDALYKKLTNAVIGMQYDYVNNYTHVHLDGDTNLMINVLAVIIGSNQNFTKVPVGEDTTQIVNIPIDLENVNGFFTQVGNILCDLGCIAESKHDNFTIGDYCQFVLTPREEVAINMWTQGFNYNGLYRYGHLFVFYNTDAGVRRWSFALIITRCEIQTPVTFTFKDSMTNAYNNRKFNGYLGFIPNLYEVETGISQSKNYLLFNGPLSNISNNHRIDYEMGANLDPFVTGAGGIIGVNTGETGRTYGIGGDATYGGGSGPDQLELNVSPGAYVQIPIAGGITHSDAEITSPMVNNKYATGGIYRLPAPAIDSATAQNLAANNIGLVCTGKESLDIYFTFENVNPSLFPSNYPFDTRNTLKIGAVNPLLNVLINDPNTDATEFEEFTRGEWYSLWVNGITLKYNENFPTTLGAGLVYYLDKTCLRSVLKDMWDTKIGTALKRWSFEGPIDYILYLIQLPYTFIKNVDYQTGPDSKTSNVFFNPDGTIPIAYGNLCPIKGVDDDGDLYYGASSGYYICSPIHEITFTLTGKNKVKLHGDFTDYGPYVKTTIFLPFVGERDIPPEFIMNEDLIVRYRISNLTGDFVVYVASMDLFTTDKNTNGEIPKDEESYLFGAPILVESGNMAIQRSISGKDSDLRGVLNCMSNSISSLGSGIYSALGNLGATVSSNSKPNPNPAKAKMAERLNYIRGGFGVLAGGAGSIASAVGATALQISGAPVNNHSANSSDAKWLMFRVPHITMSYNPPINDCSSEFDTEFNKTIGYATSRGITIKNMESDYHELESVKLDGINCTNEEREMIQNILMSGFYNGHTTTKKVVV